ncbi:hypothetical protein J2X97_003019 [Epilithonimonas hungarica]|uniref:hypothetical protein n=1 Tax=Epilithonimonas hungarica TaxID=454006 RepID=UPI0027860DC3|nr:hypothetical protein [Epilithonimonas hungarica]MDP9957350.1 hypothetical protein [Epilithonimonas hungarica]
MKIDIEKLNRKTPYPEPSEEFFRTLQDSVISKTIGERIPVVQKEAKVFSLNFKWVAAAAIVMIAGIIAFLGLNDGPEMQMAQQKPIIDSVYEIHSTEQEPAKALADNNDVSNPIQSVEHKAEHLESQRRIANLSKSDNRRNNSFDNTDRQDYAVETKRRSESEVEKVLVAFTPDQIKDIDRNSEQDVYLDLYN